MSSHTLQVDVRVIGDGIAGMQPVLGLADQGYKVALTRKRPAPAAS